MSRECSDETCLWQQGKILHEISDIRQYSEENEECFMSQECGLKAACGKIVLLPLVNKDKIRDLICELDYVFARSVMNRPGFEELINKIAERAIVIAAYVDNVAVGYSAFYMNDFTNGGTAYISLIAVKKEYQNMHVGTELIQYIKKVAAINDIIKIRLEVEKANKNAIKFYSNNGFQKESEASAISEYMVCFIA